MKKSYFKILSYFLTVFIILSTFLITDCYSQWVQVNNGGMGSNSVLSFAYNGNNLFAGVSQYDVYLSTNSGSSWTYRAVGQGNYDVFALAVSGNNLFAGTGPGVWISTNNGTNWTLTSVHYPIYSLAVNGDNIFAGTLGFGWGVFLSTNNGTTWTQTSLNNRSIRSIAVNGNNIYAGTIGYYGLYLSTDNGTSWAQTSLNYMNVYSLAVNENYVFAGTEFGTPQGVFLSTDNGTSWVQTPLNNYNIWSLASSGNNIFAGTNNGVYVSNNVGVSWMSRNEGLNSQFQIKSLCIFNNYVFAGTNGHGVYRRPLGELTGLQPISTEIPNEFSLSQNYPNPFNPSTKIKFDIPSKGLQPHVQIIVYDIMGREVEILVNQLLRPGTYEANFDGSKYSSGVYYYKITTVDFSETKKMILIK